MASGRVGRPPLDTTTLQERRELIMNATRALVAEEGADKVKLRSVAARAGVSVGTLQHYFVTRDELLRETFRFHAREVVDSIQRTAQHADPWSRIEAMILNTVRSPDYHLRCVLWVEFAAAAARDRELRELMVRAYATWRAPLLDAIHTGTAAGSLKPRMTPESVATNLLALIDGYELALAIGEQTDAEAVGQEILETASILVGRR